MRRLIGILDVIPGVTTIITVALEKPTLSKKKRKVTIITLETRERETTTLIRTWTIKSRPTKR